METKTLEIDGNSCKFTENSWRIFLESPFLQKLRDILRLHCHKGHRTDGFPKFRFLNESMFQ